MKIIGPTASAVPPAVSNGKPAPTSSSPPFGPWDTGLTDFSGETGFLPQALLASQPPATPEITSSLAAELAQEPSQHPFR